MTTLYADFNALTEDRSISLTTIGSLSDVEKYGVRPGDWVWLSDGELQVGAEVEEDQRQGLIGRPVWETLVDLEGSDSADILALWYEINLLLDVRRSTSRESHLRLLTLLNRFERVAPPSIRDAIPGSFAFRLCLQPPGTRARWPLLDGIAECQGRRSREFDL